MSVRGAGLVSFRQAYLIPLVLVFDTDVAIVPSPHYGRARSAAMYDVRSIALGEKVL